MSIWLGVALACAGGGTAEPSPEGIAFFESKVRPILVARCYECHSAGAKALRGGLLLDSKPGWEKGGDTGPAIAPGKPDESLLVHAIRYKEDETSGMPPTGKLPDSEIETLVAWVKLGAPDPRATAAPAPTAPAIDFAEARKFWSFQPLAAVEAPTTPSDEWSRSAIDRFIFAKLAEKKLAPSPSADKRTLLRRVTFDLTGLPPTPEEIDAFVNDHAPNAYERVVDRLLASPRFGERWARHWLDVARFAESHGFEHDYDRPSAYHYRDFVIRAFNDDLPYDAFVRWQLAGDEFAPGDNLALAATGFLAAGVHSTQITKNEVEKHRYDEMDDMLATTGSAFLGLTIGCARCHDHKYDPITQTDYYRMLATFTTCVRSEVDFNTDPAGYRKAQETFDAEHAPFVAALEKFEAEQLPGRFDDWHRSWPTHRQSFGWTTLEPVEIRSEGGASFAKQPDGSYLVSGPNAKFDVYTIVARVDRPDVRALRIEALADPSLVKGGPGRASNGNFALSDVRATIALQDGAATPAPLKNPRATFEQPGLPVSATIDGDAKSSWAVDPRFGKNHAAAYEFENPIDASGSGALTLTLKFNGNDQHNFGRVRISIASGAVPADLEGAGLPADALAALDAPPGQRTAEQTKAALAWYRSLDADWRQLHDAERAHAGKAPKPTLVKALISTEGLPAVRLHTQGDDFLPQTHFLKRGDPTQKLGVAEPGFLRVVTRAPEPEKRWPAQPPTGARTSYRRSAFANWVTDVDEGAGALAARVIVNRLWQHHLGRGIVATPSDFGARGDPPTHPELLDWLAGELLRNGWRLKPIHKQIVMSAVYMQSSKDDLAKSAIDPGNALYWRKPLQRLEAEAVRDAMLSCAGTLDASMYGPGTLDESSRRRSVYFTVKRSKLLPMMLVFDAPDALGTMSARPTTTVAPQALILMNHPLARDCAHAFAKRVACDSLEGSIAKAYAIAFGRAPSADEAADALAFVKSQAESYQSTGKTPADELALADFCQALICANPFIYVE